jgi:Bacterial membrane protein YfhO
MALDVIVLEPLLTIAGIALPSLLLSLAIRRWFAPISWRVCVLLLALVLIVLGRAVFTADMPVALDEVMRGYPYRGLVGPVRSVNPDTNDTAKQMLPWMQVVREELLAGRLPLWNRYSFSGYPLLGNGQSAPLSPFFLFTLFVPLPKQLVAMAGLKLFVGLLFGYLVLQREGVSRLAAAFGSVIYSLAVLQNVYLYYPLSSVTLLLPAVVFAALRVVDDGRRRSMLLLSLVVASMFAAGHPESLVHAGLGVAGLLVIEMVAPAVSAPDDRSLRARRSALAVFGAIMGAGLSAPAWVPVTQQAFASQRIAALRAGHYEGIRYPLTALWVLLNPDGFGNPARGNWRWIMHYIMVAPSYVGLIPLSLLPLPLLQGSPRRDRWLLGFTAVTFLAAMNWTVVGWAVNHLPLVSLVAYDRLRFVTIFLVAILAARGVDRIARRVPMPSLIAPTLVAGLAIYVFVKQLGATLTPLSAIGIAALIAFWCGSLASRHLVRDEFVAFRILPAIALAATAMELMVFNFPFNAMTPRRFYVPPLPIIEKIRSMRPPEPFRILGADWTLLPNASAQYGLEDIRGSDPMAWGPYVDFFRLIQAPGQSLDVGRVQQVWHPAVSFLNATFLLDEPGSHVPEPWRLVYRGKDGDLYRNETALQRFFAPKTLVAAQEPLLRQLAAIKDFSEVCAVEGLRGGEVRSNGTLAGMWLRERTPQRFAMAVDAQGPTLMASSQPALPGWIVRIDHREVPSVRVNGAFIGFWVPSGHSNVSVEYRPRAFRMASWVALLSLVWLLLPSRSRRPRATRDES